MNVLVCHLQYSYENTVLNGSMNMACQNQLFLRWRDTRCFMIFNIGFKVAPYKTKTRNFVHTLSFTN